MAAANDVTLITVDDETGGRERLDAEPWATFSLGFFLFFCQRAGQDEQVPRIRKFAHDLPVMSTRNHYRRTRLARFFQKAPREIRLQESRKHSWNGAWRKARQKH